MKTIFATALLSSVLNALVLVLQFMKILTLDNPLSLHNIQMFLLLKRNMSELVISLL